MIARGALLQDKIYPKYFPVFTRFFLVSRMSASLLLISHYTVFSLGAVPYVRTPPRPKFGHLTVKLISEFFAREILF